MGARGGECRANYELKGVRMYITVELDEQGFLPNAYGKYADAADQKGRLCVRSFPFTVHEIPADAQALAWIFLDWDSTPVCGFPWIHWCAQLDGIEGADEITVPEDAGRQGMPGLIQGYTSAAKSEPEVGTRYVGPCPPDCDHVYTLHVVALDEAASLDAPFWANSLVKRCKEHVLAEATIDLPSRA